MLVSAAEVFPLNVVLKFKGHVAGGVMAFHGGELPASPRVSHGLAGTDPNSHGGLWVGNTEQFDETSVIFGVIPVGSSPCQLLPLSGPVKLCWALLGFVKLCQVLLGPVGLCQALLGSVRLFWALSGSIGLCWTLSGSVEPYQAL